ncbi:hypothetical protein LSAT2_030036 [Lamellibrachia satsuma]|nr:hypothetical protein LSAT2_030036 [Lamellibrachia satsuma]
MEDLERRMNLAKKNFVQWGGKLEEDRRRLKENRDSQRTITELKSQLDYERLRREKLEAQIDEYRRENAYLGNKLQEVVCHSGYSYDEDDYPTDRQSATSRKKTKKKSSSRRGEEGVFIQRNVTQKKGKKNA